MLKPFIRMHSTQLNLSVELMHLDNKIAPTNVKIKSIAHLIYKAREPNRKKECVTVNLWVCFKYRHTFFLFINRRTILIDLSWTKTMNRHLSWFSFHWKWKRMPAILSILAAFVSVGVREREMENLLLRCIFHVHNQFSRAHDVKISRMRLRRCEIRSNVWVACPVM